MRTSGVRSIGLALVVLSAASAAGCGGSSPKDEHLRIAFAASEPNAKADIYVMDEDGSNLRRLTHDSAVDEFPDWSPDGRQISFTSTRDGKSDIYVMNADGSNQHRLTFDPAGAYDSTLVT